MPGSGTGTFIDPEDYQASLRQTRIDLLVTSQGTFNAHLTWATLHHLQLLRSEEDVSRIAYVSLDPALVFVGFATRPDPPMLWGGQELQPNEIIFHSPRRAVPSADDWTVQLELAGTGATSPSNDMAALLTEGHSRRRRPRGSCARPRAMRPGCGGCMRRPAALPRPGREF